MIAVAGFNSMIDRLLEVDALELGTVQRAKRVRVAPGGKGLHVALAIASLGEKACLVGIIDAAHHALFTEFLQERGVSFHGVAVRGPIGACTAVRDQDGVRTGIVEPGPTLSAEEREALLAAFLEECQEADFAVVAGGLPLGMAAGTYADIVTSLARIDLRAAVDTSGEALARAARAQPFLLTPNREEAEALTQRAIHTRDDAVRAARELAGHGVALVVLSLGAEGAIIVHEGRVFHASTPHRSVRQTLGCGDCLLGGLAAGLTRGWTIERLVSLGIACGTANALAGETGILHMEEVTAILPQVTVARLA